MRKRPLFYGWIIIVIAFACELLVYGVRNSFAVFYLAILKEFGWSRADTALIFSINIIVYGLTAPFAGALVDRFGPRRVMPVGVILLALGVAGCTRANEIWHLYLLFGVVAAIGSGLTGFASNIAVVAHWFIRKRGTAVGIFHSGWGASFIFVPISQYLISSFGWRNAYLIIGCVVPAILLPLILVFHRHRPQDMGLLPDGGTNPGEATSKLPGEAAADTSVIDKKWASTDWSLRGAMHTLRFWAVFLANLLFWGMGVNVLVAHQVAFAVDVGFTTLLVADAVSLYGIMVICGNLCGFLSDRLGREISFSVAAIMATIAVANLIFMGNIPLVWMLFVYAILLGFGVGLAGPSLTSSVADLFQGKSFGLINGVVVMGFGLAGAFSPWLAGFIFDLGGSYIPSFYIVVGAMLLSCLFVWVASPRKVRLVPGRAKAIHSRKTT